MQIYRYMYICISIGGSMRGAPRASTIYNPQPHQPCTSLNHTNHIQPSITPTIYNPQLHHNRTHAAITPRRFADTALAPLGGNPGAADTAAVRRGQHELLHRDVCRQKRRPHRGRAASWRPAHLCWHAVAGQEGLARRCVCVCVCVCVLCVCVCIIYI